MEIIILTILSVISVISITALVWYYFKSRRFIKIIAQLIVDNEIIKAKLDESIQLNSKEFSDGFIKFLSESRQSAFDYIESVQASIKNYLDAINNKDEDRIVTTRMELFSHLPEQTDKV